jgi:DNA-directed RNA polymerase subunit RPC12/RpoP
MPDCSKCGAEMKYSEIESTAMRNVYRCFKCNTRKSKRSGLRWALTAARLGLFLGTGIFDPTEFIDPTDLMG